MELLRLWQLSIYYKIKSLFPDNVTIVSEFPTDELKLPTIAITSDSIESEPLQLGGEDLNRAFWRINVFAENSAQRDDFLFKIYKELEKGIPVYDYNINFPPPDPPLIGSLVVLERELKPLRVYEDLVEKLYWWGVVDALTYYTPTTGG